MREDVTYENNIWSPTTLRTDSLEDVPLLGIWWKTSINRLHAKDEREVILLGLAEAMAVEDRALDSAEKSLVDMQLVGTVLQKVDQGLAEGQSSLV